MAKKIRKEGYSYIADRILRVDKALKEFINTGVQIRRFGQRIKRRWERNGP